MSTPGPGTCWASSSEQALSASVSVSSPPPHLPTFLISSASFLFILLCLCSLGCYPRHLFSFFLFFLSQKFHLCFGCLSTVGNSQINISKSNLLLLATNINFEVACLGSLSCWLLKVTESKTEIILPINHDAF